MQLEEGVQAGLGAEDSASGETTGRLGGMQLVEGAAGETTGRLRGMQLVEGASWEMADHLGGMQLAEGGQGVLRAEQVAWGALAREQHGHGLTKGWNVRVASCLVSLC